MELTASRLFDVKARFGPEAVVFGMGTSSGSSISDAARWLERLANAFGSPNLMAPLYICNWNREWGSHYTYGVATPSPDYDNSRCILLWGFNPHASWPAVAARISRAKAAGAKLIVVDPRSRRRPKSPIYGFALTGRRRRPGDEHDPCAAGGKPLR